MSSPLAEVSDSSMPVVNGAEAGACCDTRGIVSVSLSDSAKDSDEEEEEAEAVEEEEANEVGAGGRERRREGSGWGSDSGRSWGIRGHSGVSMRESTRRENVKVCRALPFVKAGRGTRPKHDVNVYNGLLMMELEWFLSYATRVPSSFSRALSVLLDASGVH